MQSKINPYESFAHTAGYLGWTLCGGNSHLLANSGLSPAPTLCQTKPQSSHCLGSSTPKNHIKQHTGDGLETQATLDIGEATRCNTCTILATLDTGFQIIKQNEITSSFQIISI